MKRIEAINAYEILATASLSKCDKEAKFAVLNAAHEMKKINEDFQAFSKETQEVYQKEFKDFETLRDLESRKETLADEEKTLYAQLNTQYFNGLNEVLAQKAMEEVELTTTKLNKDSFATFLESNESLKVAQIDLLMGLICE